MKYKIRIALLAIVGLLALPILASAGHWPNFGGDAGHSGNQVVDKAAMGTQLVLGPINDAGRIRTSITTTTGKDAASTYLAYGKFLNIGTGSGDNDETRIHIRDLATGEDKVAGGAQVIDESSGTGDDDVLGTDQLSVSPVNTASAGGPGQLYVVHNDDNADASEDNGCNPLSSGSFSDNDISIAQFDIESGAKVVDHAIGLAQGAPPDPTCPERAQIADGFTIESSPVITPPLDGSGRRVLFFVARRDAGGDGRLFRVEIGNAGTTDATIDFTSPEVRDIPGLNTKASPTIAYLRDPERGTVIPYVVVSIDAGAGASDIQTFKVDDISEPGHEVAIDIPGNPQTVSVPVATNGDLPGDPLGSSGTEKAPALFAAYHNPDNTTTVRKFVQVGESATLTAAPGSKAVSLEGIPSPALAVTETVRDGAGASDPDVVVPGSVVVSTGKNLIILDSTTLEVDDRYQDVNDADAPEQPLTPGTTGFSRTSPATSGGYVFITNDGGAQFVLRESDGERVPDGEFTEALENNTSDYAIGQPAYSNGYLQFFSDRGLFVYRTGVVTVPPTASYTITPNPARTGQAVNFDGSASTDSDGTIVLYEWDLDGDGTFETNTGAVAQASRSYAAPGTVRTQLRVTDNRGKASTLAKDLVVSAGPPPGANQPPTASFTASPSPARKGERVAFDARASRDPDGTIARYEWDLDGNGSFETNTGTTPTTARTYTQTGTFNVKLRVTDNAGVAAETIRQLSVTGSGRVKARSLSLKVVPKRDSAVPFSYRSTGRLRLPSGVSRSKGCKGRVTVTVKDGKRTISRRTAKLRKNCKYASRVTFSERDRLGAKRKLRFKARFQGNRAVLPRQSKTRAVRAG